MEPLSVSPVNWRWELERIGIFLICLVLIVLTSIELAFLFIPYHLRLIDRQR
jgi:hypothetical protein